MTRLRKFSRYAAPAFSVAACLGSITTSALADTYSVYKIGVPNAGSASVRGIDSSGDALYSNNTNGVQYSVYDHASVIERSDTLPSSFVPDNGTSCSFSYQQVSYQGVCNNGYEAVGIISPFNSVPTNTFVIGHDGSFTTLNLEIQQRLFFSPNLTYINSSGDVAFTVAGEEDSFQAYNTTPTPEPSAFALLLTGVGLAFAAQRRLFS